jgi:hypothetical protein
VSTKFFTEFLSVKSYCIPPLKAAFFAHAQLYTLTASATDSGLCGAAACPPVPLSSALPGASAAFFCPPEDFLPDDEPDAPEERALFEDAEDAERDDAEDDEFGEAARGVWPLEAAET